MDLSKSLVMIVDDTEENIDILVEALGPEYELSVALDGESALEDIDALRPDLILLDIMMPKMDGYEVCRRLKSRSETVNIPVMFLTAMTAAEDEEQGLDLGAVDYITKPFNPSLVRARVRNQLELKLHRDNLESLVKKRTEELEMTQEVTILCMGTLAEYRDPETGGHIQRTTNYVRALATRLQRFSCYASYFTNRTIELLGRSAPLHDIGKVGVPDHILLKPGKLTEEEFEVMKLHTVYGRDALMLAERKLGTHSFLQFAIEIAESHQEKWDGSGYPNGWKGEQIPLSGRIMAIADVYDALISKRVYKDPMPHSVAVSIIREGSGSHFDPVMVEAFLEITDEFRDIAIKHADFEVERETLLK